MTQPNFKYLINSFNKTRILKYSSMIILEKIRTERNLKKLKIELAINSD